MHDDSDDSDNDDDRGSSMAGQRDGAGSAIGVGAAQSLSAEAAAAAKRAAKNAKRAAQKAEKKRKATAHLQEKGGLQSVITPGVASEHPFDVDPRDHAETPFEAYQDIEPLLFKLAERLGTTKVGDHITGFCALQLSAAVDSRGCPSLSMCASASGCASFDHLPGHRSVTTTHHAHATHPRARTTFVFAAGQAAHLRPLLLRGIHGRWVV